MTPSMWAHLISLLPHLPTPLPLSSPPPLLFQPTVGHGGLLPPAGQHGPHLLALPERPAGRRSGERLTRQQVQEPVADGHRYNVHRAINSFFRCHGSLPLGGDRL